MSKSLYYRGTAVAVLLLLGSFASQSQGFGEAGSYGAKPNGSGAAEANVNLATGRIAPAISLITLPGIASDVTVGLQYQAGTGIQVNTTASEVGLGWALSGGGSIVRDVRGFPDDSEHGWIIDLGGNSYHEKYFYYGPNQYYLPLRTAGDVVKYFKSRTGNIDPRDGSRYGASYDNRSLLTWLYPASRVASYGQYSWNNTYIPYGQPNSPNNYQARWSGVFFPDNEPDIYTLTLPSGSLQFVLDPSGNPVPLQAQNIKIRALDLGTRTYNANGLLHEFVVTTSDGVKYYFGSNALQTSHKEHIEVKNRVLEMNGLGSKEDLPSYINN